jgi:hypothetical protein
LQRESVAHYELRSNLHIGFMMCAIMLSSI